MDDPSLNSDIIIVNHNGSDKILSCLTSIFASSASQSHVIVVDNASVDGSVQKIQEMFPQVHLIRSMVNLGFGDGCNLGVQQGKNEFLVFLNPDTYVEKESIKELLVPFQSQDNLGLTTAKILLTDQPDRINTCGNMVHLTGLTFCRGLGSQKTAYSDMEEIAAVSGAAFAMRRKLFNELGGFDSDMFLYMEDTDLSWRVRLMGKSCLFIPTSIVFHQYSLRITPQKIFYLERNRYLMLLKNLRWPTLFLSLPAQFLTEFMVWGYIFWKKGLSAKHKMAAYLWILKHWRAIMKKRKDIQLLRLASDKTLLEKTQFEIDFSQMSQGSLSTLSRLVFNPIFFVLRRMSLILVWW